MKNMIIKQKTLLSSLLITALVTGCNSQNTTDNHTTATTILPVVADQTIITTPQISSEVMLSQSIAAKQHKLRERKKYELRKEIKAKSRYMRQAPLHFTSQYAPIYNNYAENNIQDNEKYAHYKSNSVMQTAIEPVSTFSIDVDTGSYSNIRRLINNGSLPVKDAIRVEEMLNYFNYNYTAPNNNNMPFITQTEVGPSPWSKGHHLLQVGIKAIDVDEKELPAANLVFLIDVSGSMSSSNKLGLLKKSLTLLVSKMREQDKISLVVYAGASGIVLEPTSGKDKSKITNALMNLRSGGSTNGASGIRLAYQVAKQAYIKNGINRILLATDGDFNVGTTDFNQLKNLVEEKRKTGISLSTLGFGSGNYNDHLMEQLADAANGNYSYIDSLKEAHKVLVDEMSSSLKTVAKDVKIQIEFNPSVISEYRLIGYENRKLNKEDFNNDKVDAGEIGAGHTVTAFYEVTLTNSNKNKIDPLRYQTKQLVSDQKSNELAFVKIRYKNPNQETSKLISQPIYVSNIHSTIKQTTSDFKFASSVIGFGELLKGGQYQKDFGFDQIIELSTNARGKDTFGYRSEFVQLVKLAKSLNLTALQQ